MIGVEGSGLGWLGRDERLGDPEAVRSMGVSLDGGKGRDWTGTGLPRDLNLEKIIYQSSIHTKSPA